MSDLKHKLIVGLEIHVQLCTATKMFCGCALAFGEEANSRVCPVCLGMPGVLPVMNKQAVEYAALVGLSLNCKIARFTKWDRKSYYYPDLPKNYQISQYDLPLASEGYIEIQTEDGSQKTEDGQQKTEDRQQKTEDRSQKTEDRQQKTEDRNQKTEDRGQTTDDPSSSRRDYAEASTAASGKQIKRIRIRRTHLEEDAGKNLHATGNFSQVDLNRAGTPLLEIVTEPDINSAAEVRVLAEELQRIVRFLGVSEADMQKGHMRFEPNVNLIIDKDGREYRTPIAEIKNLNSFRALERSVEYEEQRQLDEFLETGRVMEVGNKSTRGWDDAREATVLQREKEEAHDYRYFPEPDLVPVEFTDEWLAEIKSRLCELPLKRQMRYVREYGLSDYDASVLTAERATAELFEKAVEAGGEPKRVCNIITQGLLKEANKRGCSVDKLGVPAKELAELAKMVVESAISASSSTLVIEQMVSTHQSSSLIVDELNLRQKSDAGELEAIVDKVLAENQQAVADVKSGGKKCGKARGFLLGQVMQKTKGQANPKVVSEIMDKKL